MKVGTLFLRALLVSTVLLVNPLVKAQSSPSAASRKDLLAVRKEVWDSYFQNDQTRLQELIGTDFLTINPGEEHWQTRDEFLAGARAFAAHHGKLVLLSFPQTEIQVLGNVAVLYSRVIITMEVDGKQESLHCRSTEIFEKRIHGWVNVGAHVDSGQ